jgi:hypothetical protein
LFFFVFDRHFLCGGWTSWWIACASQSNLTTKRAVLSTKSYLYASRVFILDCFRSSPKKKRGPSSTIL